MKLSFTGEWFFKMREQMMNQLNIQTPGLRYLVLYFGFVVYAYFVHKF